jgi:hypothetical protein
VYPRTHHALRVVLALALITGCRAQRAAPEYPSPASPEYLAPAQDGGAYAPQIDPAKFVASIDNVYLPLRVGTRWVYKGQTQKGLERVEVVVLTDTRQVMGVECTVVRDTVTVGGQIVEDTYDWFAQDRDGNVWYFGEEVSNYADGVLVDSAGTWEAGVDGAQPGVIMWADPQPGEPYRQEFYAGEAEDMARVLRLDGTAEVPYGSFSNVLVTEEWTPLEPGVKERKYYARGVGVLLQEVVEGGQGRVELIEMQSPSARGTGARLMAGG